VRAAKAAEAAAKQADKALTTTGKVNLILQLNVIVFGRLQHADSSWEKGLPLLTPAG